MGSAERSSKKKIHQWKKAMIHFSFCFTLGFVTGFTPTTTTNAIFSGKKNQFNSNKLVLPSPESMRLQAIPSERLELTSSFNKSLKIVDEYAAGVVDELPPTAESPILNSITVPGKLLIIVTPMMEDHLFQTAYLRNLANTLKLVPPPLLWIVVEPPKTSPEIMEVLRGSGIMFRHLVAKENFTTTSESMEHQRNLALNHIEHHRLNGIVHFADVFNVYDLHFFEEIRQIEVFGTWPVAMAGVDDDREVVDVIGPVCSAVGQVIGWHLREEEGDDVYDFSADDENSNKLVLLNTSGFAFNSSILFDPERWGRPSSSTLGAQQNSLGLVRTLVFEDESKVLGLPISGCSKVMLWRLRLKGFFFIPRGFDST